MKTFIVTAHSPEHEAAIWAVVDDPRYAYVPKEYPKAVNGELALDAAHEARILGTVDPVEVIAPVEDVVPAADETTDKEVK